MPGKIHTYLADDHRRLDGLLDRVFSGSETIDAAAYGQFRTGLLKHIAMEEKIILPAAQKRRGGVPLAVAAKLRLDHGALTALLVFSPTARTAAVVRVILSSSNPMVEIPGGVYDECDPLSEGEGDRILRELQNYAGVKVLPNVHYPFETEATRSALARAGYALKV